MQVYVVYLPNDIVKKQKVTFVGDEIVVKVIDHKVSYMDMKIDDSFHNRQYGFILSENEKLNFITHYSIWNDFFATGKEWCLIIESNISAVLSSEEVVKTIIDLKQQDPNWDIFFPYDLISIREDYFKTKNGRNLINTNNEEIQKIHPYLLNFKWGNSIYLLSKKGVEKLLQIEIIDDRLDDTLLRLSETNSLTVYYDSVDWFSYDSIIPYEWPDRCASILYSVLTTISWDDSSKSKVKYLLYIMSRIGHENKIDLLLQGGSHLGYIRHGGIMPWDDDVDIGIEESNVDFFLEELSKYDDICFGEYIELRTDTPYYKVWKKNGEIINGHSYTFPFVDLWVYNRVGKDIVFKNGIICPNSAGKPYFDIIYEGAKLQIVGNSFEVLDSRYSDWRNFIHIYPYSHRLESPIRQYICIPIQTDEKGRANFPKQTF